jgi:nitrous oxide reductase accessory protein NosL
MKQKHVVISLIVSALLGIAVAAAIAGSDIDEFRSCVNCGMDRKAYGYSRTLISYQDGTQVGTCSLHCAVEDMTANKVRVKASLKVADRDTRSLIDAEKAVWVIGGRKRGVMTQRAKWAFSSKDTAQVFVDAHGGVITDWDAALLAAREDASAFGSKR